MSATATTRRGAAALGFLIDTAICQTIAVALVFLLWKIGLNYNVSLIIGPLIAGAIALFFALPLPWQLLNIIIIPASALSLAVDIPNWVFPLLFFGTVLIYAPAIWTRVPYYPTSTATYLMLLPELPKDKPFTFVDLGCGFGDLLLFLSKHRPLGRYVGVEIGLLPCLAAKIRAFIFGSGRVSVHFKSIWSTPISEDDYVYTFLSPAPMAKMWEKIKNEMRSDAVYLNNSFPVPSSPTREIEVGDDRGAIIFVHEFATVHQVVNKR